VSRIAVVVSGFPRRSETFALNELVALEERGLLAGVWATKPGDGGETHPAYARLAHRTEWLAPGTPAEQGRALGARLAATSIDAVHGYFAHAPAEVAEHAAERLAVPFGFSVHARDARKVAAAALAARARRAACVVACNADVAGELGGAAPLAHIVPHGVDLERFQPSPAPAAPPVRVLAVGRLVEKKGFDILVEACAGAADAFTLRIVGDGPERARLQERIRHHRLDRRVELVGSRTHAELPSEYAAAHVVVVPSVVDATGDRDGLPNVVLEALASGRPVIATRVGAIESAVRNGETGLLVPPRVPHAIADALSALAADAGLRDRLGAAGRRAVGRHYDLAACSRRFASLLEEVYGPA
jgi:glycosyltransferase involved in cell wall biosynthesis